MVLYEGYENLEGAPPIGSVEHIQFSAKALANLPLLTREDLHEALMAYLIPESLAHFIFQNRTFQNQKPKLWFMEDKTAVLDTRHVTGYNGGPIIDAVYNYDPMRDNNYVSIFGRLYPHDPAMNYSYYLRMSLQDNLNLETRMPIEADIQLGDPVREIKVYRSQVTDLHYAEEMDPSLVAYVLGEVAEGFGGFVEIRSNL